MTVQVGSIPIGSGAPLVLIAGPCVLQDRIFNVDHASRLKDIATNANIPLIFKASFDKANRTRATSPRGPGLEEGLRLLEEVKAQVGLPILTDVHLPGQCGPVAEVADVLQIPAFLCRQTDLLVAAGATGRPVNVKKGQFLSPEDLTFAKEKVGHDQVLFTERGTTFGYRDLVVDFRGLATMRSLGPVVFDGTHSVQRPGSAGGQTGGDRTLVPALVRAAVAVGVDALFLEVHPDPDHAPSDGPNSLNYSGLVRVLDEAMALKSCVDGMPQAEGAS